MIVADWVDEALRAALCEAGLDTVDGAFAFAAGEELDKPGLAGRRRTRLELTDANGRRHELYLKRYPRERAPARLRRAWTHGCGRGPARVEYDNIRAAQAAGVPTMRAVACGQRRGRSWLIVTAVPGEALERCVEDVLAADDAEEMSRRLAASLGRLAATLHGAGWVHRDLYASHVFLDAGGAGTDLYLIDLARMFRPRWRRRRWIVKDLAALRYSMPREWVNARWAELLAAYAPRASDGERGSLDAAVRRKTRRIARHAERKRAREHGE
ncbi:MAG: lipopolysaccharide kinase InaA family protein [Planctomycetota bacterium]